MVCYFLIDTYIDVQRGRGKYDQYIEAGRQRSRREAAAWSMPAKGKSPGLRIPDCNSETGPFQTFISLREDRCRQTGRWRMAKCCSRSRD